jgi:peptidyl-prolyl cis-trans isomerase D
MEAPISEPVQTGFGWHVIQLRDIRESQGMSFEEARPILVREYEDENAARAFLEQADRLVDLIYEDPTTLESAALVLELPVNEAGPFTRTGGDGIAAFPEVVEAAFSDLVLLQGSVSDPVNLDENRLVMIKLKEHLPVAVKPLAEVRDEIVTTLSDNQALDNAKAKANEILAAVQSGNSELEVLAEEYALEHGVHESIKRNSQVPDAVLVSEIFRLQKPTEVKPVEAVLPTSTGFAIVELNNVVQGATDDGMPLIAMQHERVISNSNGSMENAAVMSQLRAVANIEIFEDRIR